MPTDMADLVTSGFFGRITQSDICLNVVAVVRGRVAVVRSHHGDEYMVAKLWTKMLLPLLQTAMPFSNQTFFDKAQTRRVRL